MARRKSRTLTEVELEFMQILWTNEEFTTEDVQNALKKQDRELTDGSIRKILSILMKKGYVSRRREGRGFLYHARVMKGQANKTMIHDLLNKAFGGSASNMVAALFDSRAIQNGDIDKIKQLIEEYEKES